MSGEAFKIVESGNSNIAKEVAKLQRLDRANLRRELRAGLASVSKPARMRVKADEMNYLPQGNGFAKKYAHVPAQTYSISGGTVSMKWKQRKAKADLQSLNRGSVRHPLFGNKHYWYDQSIKPGMWTESVQKEGAPMVEELQRKLIEYTERVTRG